MQDTQLHTLLKDLQDGDRDALEALYQEFSTPIYTIILRMTKDIPLAEDILQEFFVKLFRQPPAVIPRNPRAYLFQMAHNLTVDCLRKERPAAPLDDYAHKLSFSGTPDPERLDLERALSSLDDTDREIVLLHAAAGLKFREVAEVVALPLGTVLWRYHRTIGSLRQQLNGGTL